MLISLTRESGELVLTANLIAWPIGFYAMTQWLERFAYRIDLQVWQFASAGAVALVVALGTVAHQALKAASTNPVEALRQE